MLDSNRHCSCTWHSASFDWPANFSFLLLLLWPWSTGIRARDYWITLTYAATPDNQNKFAWNMITELVRVQLCTQQKPIPWKWPSWTLRLSLLTLWYDCFCSLMDHQITYTTLSADHAVFVQLCFMSRWLTLKTAVSKMKLNVHQNKKMNKICCWVTERNFCLSVYDYWICPCTTTYIKHKDITYQYYTICFV